MVPRSKGEIIRSLNKNGLDKFNFISCHLSELESEADVRETLEVCLDTVQVYALMIEQLRSILNFLNSPSVSAPKTDKEIIEMFRTVFDMTYDSEADHYDDTRIKLYHHEAQESVADEETQSGRDK